MENVITYENVISSVVYNVVNDVVDESTYRVTLEKPIKGYRTVDGNRVETDVISFLLPRNVLLAQVLNKLPMLARIYSATKKQFDAVETNAGKVLPFVDQLNTFLKGGPCVIRSEFHAAGETIALSDGSEIVHKVDKYNIEITAIQYGTIGAGVVANIEAEELKKATNAALVALGLA